MPIINIRFIKDVVATEEQKAELIEKMTDTFVGVLGDVVRPFTYCIIDEVPIGLWGIGGVPMPDLPYLVGEEFAEVREKSNQTMRDAIAQMAADAEDGRGVDRLDVVLRRSERDHPALERGGLVGRQVRARPRDHLAEHDRARRRRPGRRHGPGRADRPDQDLAHRVPGRPHGDRRPDRRGRHGRDPQHLVRDAGGRVLRHPAERQVGRRHLGRHRPRHRTASSPRAGASSTWSG